MCIEWQESIVINKKLIAPQCKAVNTGINPSTR